MGQAFGYVNAALTAGTEVACNATTYTEPTSGAQRSVKSASANDAAAGTGARTVKLTYYTLDALGNIAGPYSEVLTLNGTTAVPTVGLNIALIDRIEVLTAGSGGVPAGAISLYTDNAGAAAVITSIAAGDRRTFLAHAYVPTGRRITVTDIEVLSGEVVTVQTVFGLRSLTYGVAGAAEQAITNALSAQGLNGTRTFGGAPAVAGPARLQLYCTPGATAGGATLLKGQFGYYLT